MTSELWQLYLRLQTLYAYRDGVQQANGPLPTYGLDVDDPRVWGVPVIPAPCVLLIGPGGTAEIEWLRRLAPDASLYVLTATQKELDLFASDVRMAVLGDIHDLPYPSGYFDYILALNVLEHAFAPYIALLECRRVLKDAGAACFLMPSFRGAEGGKGPFHLHCLTEEVWGQLLVKVGLDAVYTRVLHGDVEPEDFYLQFICRAVPPPSPHDRLLSDIRAYKA